jgi:hypothetical protein
VYQTLLLPFLGRAWEICGLLYILFSTLLFFFLAFPIHESASFTLEWLFVELGLFYMQEGMEKSGWMCRISLLVTKFHIERLAFYPPLLSDDMVDTLKNHIHFNRKN